MYVSARQLIAAGLEGKWVKVTPEESQAIIDSVPGENLLRAAKGLGNIWDYVNGEHVLVHTADVQPESGAPLS